MQARFSFLIMFLKYRREGIRTWPPRLIPSGYRCALVTLNTSRGSVARALEQGQVIALFRRPPGRQERSLVDR